jgi:eukaryotic-like serine/threonine-protein kinase
MSLTSGQRLQNGKYEIIRELGRGRVGITYLATRADGERWVIKLLNPDVIAALNEKERDRLESLFWQEAVKLAKCRDSPHIVTVEMPFKEGPLICLPIEYLAGSSLGDRDQRILSEATALKYIGQIGAALTVVHRQKLVHRDICPANIFLRIRESNAEAVLTDFGLAVDCDSQQTLTRRQERLDGFSPIELYSRAQPVGPYTDVYALAATLYELLTGEVPISAEARKLQGEPLISPQVKNPDISGRTTKAIVAGMALAPEDRPASTAAWLKLMGIAPLPSSIVKDLEANVNWSKWQTVWAAIAALIAAIAVIVPTWLALKAPAPTGEQQAERIEKG